MWWYHTPNAKLKFYVKKSCYFEVRNFPFLQRSRKKPQISICHHYQIIYAVIYSCRLQKSPQNTHSRKPTPKHPLQNTHSRTRTPKHPLKNTLLKHSLENSHSKAPTLDEYSPNLSTEMLLFSFYNNIFHLLLQGIL